MPRSGIAYGPELEWGLAMQWSGHTLREWEALSGDEQGYLIALYRAHGSIEAVINYTQSQEMKNK